MSAGEALGRQWHIEHHDDSYTHSEARRLELYDKKVPPDNDTQSREMLRQKHFAGALHYYVAHDNSHIGVDDLEVGSAHQRKGGATAMYGELHKLHPDIPVRHYLDHMTDDSKALADHLIEKFPGKHEFRNDF